jgi:hypothetical protein
MTTDELLSLLREHVEITRSCMTDRRFKQMWPDSWRRLLEIQWRIEKIESEDES